LASLRATTATSGALKKPELTHIQRKQHTNRIPDLQFHLVLAYFDRSTTKLDANRQFMNLKQNSPLNRTLEQIVRFFAPIEI
jgi:hypothetical protein